MEWHVVDVTYRYWRHCLAVDTAAFSNRRLGCRRSRVYLSLEWNNMVLERRYWWLKLAVGIFCSAQRWLGDGYRRRYPSLEWFDVVVVPVSNNSRYQ
jgi:hypothetical protein